ncbi:MAG: DMT family transporter [bacterium]|nr:DMT family transporter [bacterium]
MTRSGRGLLLAVAAAALSGLAMTLQGTFNAVVGKRVDLPAMILLVHVTGLAIGVVVYLLWGKPRRLPALSGIPWYALLGGVLGVIIIAGVAYALARTGIALGVAVILTSQLITGVVVDHFGLFGTERIAAAWPRLVGAVLMVAGTRLMLWRPPSP